MRPAPIEQALIRRFTGEWPDVTVDQTVPSPRPKRMLLVSRAGGGRVNLVQARPRLLFEAWAPTRQEAWQLACDAYDLVDALPTSPDSLPLGEWVTDVEIDEPVWYPDEQTKTPRWQFVASLLTDLKD